MVFEARLVRANVPRLLQFFDEAPPDSQKHATSIVAIAGEDLGVGLLKHCLEATQETRVRILSETPTTGKRKGPRLDRWVEIVRPDGCGQLFQAEIKNWSAHAIGGRQLRIDPDPEGISRFMIHAWEGLWKNLTGEWYPVSKVLTPMKRPASANPSYPLEPLLVYWTALHPTGLGEPFFSFPLPGQGFSRIWVFSASSYLRGLYNQQVNATELEMPNAAKRLWWLSELFAYR
jgi:hypothetical protein